MRTLNHEQRTLRSIIIKHYTIEEIEALVEDYSCYLFGNHESLDSILGVNYSILEDGTKKRREAVKFLLKTLRSGEFNDLALEVDKSKLDLQIDSKIVKGPEKWDEKDKDTLVNLIHDKKELVTVFKKPILKVLADSIKIGSLEMILLNNIKPFGEFVLKFWIFCQNPFLLLVIIISAIFIVSHVFYDFIINNLSVEGFVHLINLLGELFGFKVGG